MNTNLIVVRPIEPEDNKALALLIREVFDEYDAPRTGSVYSDTLTDSLYECFQQNNAEYWVAESDGQIVGGCGFYPTEGLPQGCAEIVKFYLSASVRGKGIGSYLLHWNEKRAKRSGFNQLYLESFPHFKEAVSLYERSGFRHISDAVGNSGHYATTIHMLKDIRTS